MITDIVLLAAWLIIVAFVVTMALNINDSIFVEEDDE